MKTATAPLPPLRSVKVLDQLRERIRYLHYSLPTEQAYVHSGSCLHPFPRCVTRQPWAAAKSRHFCPGWRTSAKVSVSTHRQALAALLFFYGKVLCTDLLLASGRSEDSAVAALAGGADPG